MPAAGLSPDRFDAAPFGAEIPYALDVVEAVRRDWPEMAGWVNFPLFNGSGDAGDLRLELYEGPARPTAHAEAMPGAAAVVMALGEQGFAIQQARIAVLGPRELLRCHVDMYPAARLITPLNARGDWFRHVFGADCVAMRPGEIWAVDGDACHGAAHVGGDGHRVALLIDARLDHSAPPGWFTEPWSLPGDRCLPRPAWSDAARAARRAATADLPFRAAEREWLMLPFEYALSPEEAYAELVGWCEGEARLERAAHWRRHACLCVPPGPTGSA